MGRKSTLQFPSASIAGLPLTLGGIFALGQGMIYVVANESLGGFTISSMSTSCCGAIMFFLGLFGIIGGKLSGDRKHLCLVIVACIAITLTFTFYVIGPLLGIIALMLVWESRYDFESH